MGLRDYVAKNGFPGVLLGISGGIDSALCAAIAVDARNDVAALARKAYSSMRVTPPAVKAKPRKVPAVRKSAKRKAA